MKISEEELELRKERIINTAFHLFCQKGIEQISIKNIAQAAKVSESTIYRYYQNKPNLVFATLSVLWKAISGQLEKNVASTPHYEQMSGYEQIMVWIDGCQLLYLENAAYILFSYESKLYLQRNGVKLTQKQYDSLMDEIEKPCIAAIEKGIHDGSIPVTESSEDLFYAIWGTLRGYIVKIVIYESLCEGGGPWRSRYPQVKTGILTALHAGWDPSK